MTYLRLIQKMNEIRKESYSTEKSFEKIDKLFYEDLDRKELVDVLLELIMIVTQSDIDFNILENPFDVLEDIKKEDKKPDLKIVH
jgi:hypothetical protein